MNDGDDNNINAVAGPNREQKNISRNPTTTTNGYGKHEQAPRADAIEYNNE